jgi:CheY-like chemotaxis protein
MNPVRRVLIVDDDPLILDIYSAMLTRAGYSVHATPASGKAVQILTTYRVDLLILDLDMPEPDGFTVLKLIRSALPELKILVVSGVVHGSILRAAKLAGAMATLDKAEVPKLLVETVQGLLR